MKCHNINMLMNASANHLPQLKQSYDFNSRTLQSQKKLRDLLTSHLKFVKSSVLLNNDNNNYPNYLKPTLFSVFVVLFVQL